MDPGSMQLWGELLQFRGRHRHHYSDLSSFSTEDPVADITEDLPGYVPMTPKCRMWFLSPKSPCGHSGLWPPTQRPPGAKWPVQVRDEGQVWAAQRDGDGSTRSSLHVLPLKGRCCSAPPPYASWERCDSSPEKWESWIYM